MTYQISDFPHYSNFISFLSNQNFENNRVFEKHHIIPKSLEGSDTSDNIIRIPVEEHLLCHFILWLDSYLYNDNYLTEKLFYPLKRMFDENSIQYQKLNLNDIDRLKPYFEKVERKKYIAFQYISDFNKGNTATKGRIFIHKNSTNKLIRPEDLNRYEKNGWKKGKYISEEQMKNLQKQGFHRKNAIVAEETKNKISLKAKNKRWIYKSEEQKRIDLEDLNEYLENGWTQGYPPGRKRRQSESSKGKSMPKGYKRKGKSNKGQIYINNGEVNKMIEKNELDSYISYGWVEGRLSSEAFKKSNKENNLGKIVIHKGDEHRYVYETEVQDYLEEGWEYGVSENSRTKGVTINKDGKHKKIKKENLQEYLDNGWQKGMIVHKKQCSICGKWFDPGNYAKHMKNSSCGSKSTDNDNSLPKLF